MNFFPRRYDQDGIRLSLFGRYVGTHERPKPVLPWYEKPLTAVVILVGAAVIAAMGLSPKAAADSPGSKTEAAIDRAENDLVNRLNNGEPIGYVIGYKLAMNNRFCIQNPAVLNANGKQYLVGIGRVSLDDPSTTLAVSLGPKQDNAELHLAKIVWSKELGAYATPELVKVGAGNLMENGDSCGNS